MIRRWSCLNQLNSHFDNSFSLLLKNNKVNIFKNSVNFKRYKFKYTKFKRKAITRVFHISTLLIYTNVFKTWSKDYLFNKHKFKNEYLFNIFSKNFYFYNFNFIKNKNENIFSNFNFVFSYLVKNKISNSGIWAKNSLILPLLKNNTFSYAWFNNNPDLNQHIVPIYSIYESTLFAFSHKNSTPSPINLLDFFSIIDLFKFENIKEFYRIISIFILKNVYFSK